MPLEINEIGIKMRVREGERTEDLPPGVEMSSGECGDSARDAVVDACVRRVLEILRARQER